MKSVGSHQEVFAFPIALYFNLLNARQSISLTDTWLAPFFYGLLLSSSIYCILWIPFVHNKTCSVLLLCSPLFTVRYRSIFFTTWLSLAVSILRCHFTEAQKLLSVVTAIESFPDEFIFTSAIRGEVLRESLRLLSGIEVIKV